MKKISKGYTLIEMLVVVLIIGILASFAVPSYIKTSEYSKLNDAKGTLHMVWNARRMFNLEYPLTTLSHTAITNACNTGACSEADTTICRLVRCNYIARTNWDGLPYFYSVFYVSPTVHWVGANRMGTSKMPYAAWAFSLDANGDCFQLGNCPACASSLN